MIEITDRALKQMTAIAGKNNHSVVRYELYAGGCAGVQSKWGTEETYSPEDGEQKWSLGDNKWFIVDRYTLTYMDNATIDYTGDFMPEFRVTIPDRQACGCGSSVVA